MVAVRECCFVKDTSFKEVEDLHEVKTGSALHQNVTQVLVDRFHDTSSARRQTSSAQIFKGYIKNTVRLMSSVLGPGAHDHTFSLRSNVLSSEQQPPLAYEGGKQRED